MSDEVFKGLPDAGGQGQSGEGGGEGQPEQQQQDPNLPEELKGKSPGEIYETLKQEHERIMQEEQQRSQQQQQQYQQQGQQYQQAPAQQGQQQQKQQYQPPYNPYSGGQDNSSEEDDYEPFPGVKSFMDKQLNKRLNPLVQTTFTSLREQNKNALMNKIGQDKWEKYGGEIEQLVSGMSPQVQVDPRAYDQAYKFVQANHIDDIANEKAEQLATQRLAQQQEEEDEDYEPEAAPQKPAAQQPRASLFQNNTGTPHVARPASSASTKNQNKSGKPKLSSEEKAVAKKFGMSEKEYAEWSGE